MESGGNAFDAAICATAVLGVVEPANSGLGGGGLWLLKKAHSDHIVMIDGREESSGNTNPKRYKSNHTLASVGSLSCAIPGTPAAWSRVLTP